MGDLSAAKLVRHLYFHPPKSLRLILVRLGQIWFGKKRTKMLTLEDLVNLAFSFKFVPLPEIRPGFAPFSVRPAQLQSEISQLLGILIKQKPKTVLEIGTWRGGTLFLFCQVSAPDATLISLDLPEGYPEWKVPFYRSFARTGQKIHLLRMNSHSKMALDKIVEVLGGREVDFLFIDGDHSYEGVRKDFETYSRLVRAGGVIALHDIVSDYMTRYGIPTTSHAGDVPRFWSEIKHNHRYFEILMNPQQDGCGIGALIWV